MSIPIGTPALLTSKEVATLLRISGKTLQRYRRSRKINYITVGGKILFRQTAVELFIAQREVRAA